MIPITKQQLPKPLLSSSAIQPRSLAKTPTALNTLTGPEATWRKAIITGNSDGKAIAAPQLSHTDQASGEVAKASASSPATIVTGLAVGPPGGNPFGYPPPHPRKSQFQYAIYPSTAVYNRLLQPTTYVNTKNPFPPDIIFSINLRTFPPPIDQSLSLHEIDFRIPIGDPALRTNWNTDIVGGAGLVPANSSPGISARMLSNQRWVVHMDVSAAYLNLRVIPRTLNLTVPVSQNTTLSFKLNEVEIAGPLGKSVTTGKIPVFVNITVTEIYGFHADVAKTQWVNQGSAQQTLDLQRQ